MGIYMRRIANTIMLFLLIFQWSAFAQQNYSIKELVDSAFQTFELIKAQQLKIDEMEALRKYNTQWKNPEISAYYGSKSIESHKGDVAGVSIVQPLYFPGKISFVDEIYRYKKNYEALSYEEMKYFIASTVINLSYDYAIKTLHSDHINSRLNRLKIINAYMSGRPVISPQKRVEIAIVKNTIRMLESEIYKLKADKATTFARLALYTRIASPQLSLHINWITNPPLYDINAIEQKAKKESLLVKKQKQVYMASVAELSLSKKNIFPDFSILFNYDYEKVIDSEKTISGGISIPIPLYNQNQNEIKAMQSRVKQEEFISHYVEKMIETDIRTIMAQYDYYRNLLGLYSPDLEDELNRSMVYADNQFQRGTITLQSYLELDVQVHETLENIYTTQKELVRNISAIACLINDYTILLGIAQ